MSARRRKILGDLQRDKLNAVLAVALTALGTASFVLFTGSAAMVRADYHAQYVAADQPDLIVGAANPMSGQSVDEIRALPEIDVVEPFVRLNGRLRDGTGWWREFELTAVEDLRAWRLGRSTVVTGSASPAAGEILVDQSAIDSLELDVGSATQLELPDGAVVDIRIVGLSRQPGRAAWFEPPAFGVTTTHALAASGVTGPNALAIRLVESDRVFGFPGDDPLLRALAELLAAAGNQLRGISLVEEPGETSLDATLDGIDFVLGALGGLGLLSGGFLVAATVVALLRTHRRQIGVLQAIGASPHQLLLLYSGVIAAVVAPGVLFGLVGGLVGAFVLSSYVAGLINVAPQTLTPPVEVIGIQMAASGLVAATIALAAMWGALRVPAALNLRDMPVRAGRVARSIRLLETVWCSMAARIGLRNALRRGPSSVLIIASLSLGGGLFLAVVSVGAGVTGVANVQSADVTGYRILAWLMGGVGALIGSMAALGLFASTLAGVGERRRELAVLAALGMSPWRLGRVVVDEAVGTAVLGWIGALILWPLFAVPLGAQLGETLTGVAVVPTPGVEPIVLVAALLSAALAAAAVPTAAALRLRPADGLGYE